MVQAQVQYPVVLMVLLLLGTSGAAWGGAGDGPVPQMKELAAVVAMERAQRQAAGPLKAILEAAKIERRPVAIAPLGAPVAATPRRRSVVLSAVRTAAAGTPPLPAPETFAQTFVLPVDATSAGDPSRPDVVAAAAPDHAPAPEPAPVPAPAPSAPAAAPAAPLPPTEEPPHVQPVPLPHARSEPGAATASVPLPGALAGEAKRPGLAAAEPSKSLPPPAPQVRRLQLVLDPPER